MKAISWTTKTCSWSSFPAWLCVQRLQTCELSKAQSGTNPWPSQKSYSIWQRLYRHFSAFVCHMAVRGMRAIKSVLVVAGGFKRADPSLTEQVRGCWKGWTSCCNLKGETYPLIMLIPYPCSCSRLSYNRYNAHISSIKRITEDLPELQSLSMYEKCQVHFSVGLFDPRKLTSESLVCIFVRQFSCAHCGIQTSPRSKERRVSDKTCACRFETLQVCPVLRMVRGRKRGKCLRL